MSKLFKELGEQGDLVIDRLETDPDFTSRVVSFMVAGLHSTHKMAQVIMGNSFLGVDDVQKFFKIALTPDQLSRVQKIPYSNETLYKHRKTHMLVLCVPGTNFRRFARFEMTHFPEEWEDNPTFMYSDVGLGWCLISRRIEFNLQLAEGKRLPTWAEAVYAFVLKNMRDNKSYPLRDKMGLCLDANGKRLFVGTINHRFLTLNRRTSFNHPVRSGPLSVIVQ